MEDIIIAKRLVATEERARSRGIVFNLSFRKLKQLMLQKKCYYTGITFNNQSNRLRMSIERVDNTKRYIDSNVVACTSIANSLKSSLSLDQIQIMVKQIKFFEKKSKENEKNKNMVT